MKKAFLFSVLTVAALVFTMTNVFAAPGDLLLTWTTTQVDHRYGTYGMDYDGSRILYADSQGTRVYFTDLAGNDLGSIQLIDPDSSLFPPQTALNALAYDFDDGVLYSGGRQSTNLYKTDLSTGVTTVVKEDAVPPGYNNLKLVTNLAWDPRDDSLWMADAFECVIYHLDLNGNQISSIDVCNITGYGSSGIAISPNGTMLYANPWYKQIYLVDTTTSPPSLKRTLDAAGNTIWDMVVCGPKFTKSDGAEVNTVLGHSYSANNFVAIEVPAGICSTTTHEPVVDPITVGPDLVQTGATVSASGTFTDADTSDTHAAEWNWGDGSTSAGAVTEGNGNGLVNGSHAYTAAGIYAVTLTVTDNTDLFDNDSYQYVVVYDPNGGFVSGNGWIYSTENTYYPDPSLKGKAHFAFVSKYQKGASQPTGVTTFQFQTGNLDFRSDTYEWLVVSGAKATFKGTGTINGTGDYGFLVSGIDGQMNSRNGMDEFRIKIWDRVSGDLIYDTQMGADETATPATVLLEGNIIIH